MPFSEKLEWLLLKLAGLLTKNKGHRAQYLSTFGVTWFVYIGH